MPHGEPAICLVKLDVLNVLCPFCQTLFEAEWWSGANVLTTGITFQCSYCKKYIEVKLIKHDLKKPKE